MFLLLIKLQTTLKRKAIPINHKKKIIKWKRRFLLRKYYLIKKIKILSGMYQKKENPKIPKTRSAKIRNVSNKVKKENRLINNNPRLNSFRTII